MKRQEAIEKLKELIGKDLHELAKKYGVTIYKNGKVNKGWAGHVFERHLQIPINSSQSPNFGSWELKSVPLKYNKNGKIAFKETMAITMIDPINVCQKEFEDSHLLEKLKKALIVARTVGSHVDDPTYIHSVTEFSLSGKLYKAVKADYDLVRNALLGNSKALDTQKLMVASPQVKYIGNEAQKNFHKLTGKMGVYIQPRTKGQGHGSTSRAFYARKGFLAEFINLG